MNTSVPQGDSITEHDAHLQASKFRATGEPWEFTKNDPGTDPWTCKCGFYGLYGDASHWHYQGKCHARGHCDE